ncbi:MAG TPA: lysozyme inhibitor LprI family protein [Bacteroidia bacterium]|jgi:uncharacterized protein YecT (DUF1311 family)|nr:lysozyme inhibitor LprI family protein [Bacteroidia bacterium]
MRIILIILFIISSFFCFSQQTQLEMNETAYKNYEQADKELNVTYQKILKEYKTDTAFIKNLKAAQRIWVQFRDAEVKAIYPDREPGYYGSIQPLCKYNYLADFTTERTKKLKMWLDGAEEGDVCSGSIKAK